MLREAMFYEKLDNKSVKCNLCSHRCSPIAESNRGICGVRENKDGKLYSLVYGKAVACAVDPIEKKPLFNFLPGSKSYSIATVGCMLATLPMTLQICQYLISELLSVHRLLMEPAKARAAV